MEEIGCLKDDLQFLMENRKTSKLKETLRTESLNNSHNSSFLLNNSYFTTPACRKYNLRDHIKNSSGLTKFQEFLNQYNDNRNIILLVDSKMNIWELIKRTDISLTNITNGGSDLVSIVNKIKNSFNEERLLNIELKGNFDNRSVSDLDISKVTDFNISHYIKETGTLQNTENL
jgi:hypothetical protein